MTGNKKTALSADQLANVLRKVPVGTTVIDMEGHMLYYNEFCSGLVDRKPEYIGKDIRICHKKSSSIKIIDRTFSDMIDGKIKEYYYETKRGGYKLGITFSPFENDGQQIGFIQCISILR
jgi:DUF438 domain-containing protein